MDPSIKRGGREFTDPGAGMEDPILALMNPSTPTTLVVTCGADGALMGIKHAQTLRKAGKGVGVVYRWECPDCASVVWTNGQGDQVA